MLEILTHFNKLDRVSRLIDPDNFVATPGIWAEVEAAGSIANVTTSTPAAVNKLVIGNRSDNIYESHDTSIGRITTMETLGVRIKVDEEGYDGTINLGAVLMVSAASGTEGKLVDVGETSETGNFEHVARAEEVNDTEGYIVYKTISPYVATLS